MEYRHLDIERKWNTYWKDKELYKIKSLSEKPKYYVLDMFPYPSGTGLHVGHPLGYIASDIIARYKRLKGFHVLHPMGFDAFGLPAEQYAIDTGQHPAKTTEQNIETFKKQLDKLGLCYDWSREIRSCDAHYYRWTQWIFLQVFNSWYDKKTDKAKPIDELISVFEKEGNTNIDAVCDESICIFSADEWKAYSEKQKSDILLKYRLTYLGEADVNWCADLGCVLANDEVKDGVSERGGYPVERKKMKQWMMRITAYADRLVENLKSLDWPTSMKEMQTNWIGKSYGSDVHFELEDGSKTLTVFTTRPDTIYGVTYLVIAPEHEWTLELTQEHQREEVNAYIEKVKRKSERERDANIKQISGVFTGSYVINPINNERIPLWVADYVLAGYGTGIVMAVPSSDDRDYRFAKHFDLPIRLVIEGTEDLENPTEKKHGKMMNSGMLNGMEYVDAIQAVIEQLDKEGKGKKKVNYRFRDAVFGRQRYWGEPIPIYYKDGIPKPLPESELPLVLPQIENYKPTKDGQPPLARLKDWKYQGKYEYELTTMPGWAASNWYFLRYMDSQNQSEFVAQDIVNYWNAVDLYIGGPEHAVGHLLYSRFWNLFLYDKGLIPHEEPFSKLVNQGMIQGISSLLYKHKEKNVFYSADKKTDDSIVIKVDISLVDRKKLNIDGFRKWREEYQNAEFVLNDANECLCDELVEKMSKSRFNTINPDDIIEQYGADTFRLYEMFLGPLEQSKPWNTDGIEGVVKFLRKLWRLFYNDKGLIVEDDVEDDKTTKATFNELKVLHKTIKKVGEDLENLSFNTSVSAFMIAVNELTQMKCHKKEVLKDFLVILSPFAPHIAEELWSALGEKESILLADFPVFNEKYLVEQNITYPISVSGKVRQKLDVPAEISKEDLEKLVLEDASIQKWIDGKSIKRFIIVPKRIINIVI